MSSRDQFCASMLRYLKVGCGGLVLVSGLAQPQTRTTATPKFEVASIKPCGSDFDSGERGGASKGQPSPGRLNLNCQTVAGLIQMAYLFFANGHLNPGVLVPLSGGPAWISSDRYSINATVGGAQSQEVMRGPMMQALLEDRFQLKVHREIKEIPVYELTVAKRGPKLVPFREGSCNPMDFSKFPPSPPENMCISRATMNGVNVTVEARGATLSDFCKLFLNRLDRPVIEKTGISGKFNFHLIYAPETDTDAAGPGSTVPDSLPGPSIFTALQEQLGLKLERTKGPGEALVIDRVEKPSVN